ncbi:MAG: biotin--[acetyl-CoA-carboxylase] ligase [Leptospiraceae bacterium]|nr:biotin--[acetyl-CoA-carboxylase] ligase [Leptospiraceae bacterium]MCP5493648.1 biotin--[acetyl-CoA-carboxylase] ligase [Leptospiraceae bacterium]
MSIVLLDYRKKIFIDIIDSTNTYLKNPAFEPGSWIVANSQTEGKGRNNRKWTDIGDEKIIFSGKIQFNTLDLPFTLLPIFVAKAIVMATVKSRPEFETVLKVKWPNDIYLYDRKVSGILVESEIIENKFIAIIGIGINIFGSYLPGGLESAGYLLEHSDPVLKNVLLENLVLSINEHILLMANKNTIQTEISWLYDRLYQKDKLIAFDAGTSIMQGKVIGLTEQGFLLVETKSGSRYELMDTTPNFKVLKDE